MATLVNVLYATNTLSNAPDLHSWMNSARDRAFGSITSAIEDREDQTSCALNVLLVFPLLLCCCVVGDGRCLYGPRHKDEVLPTGRSHLRAELVVYPSFWN